jgi:hypothetical protein
MNENLLTSLSNHYKFTVSNFSGFAGSGEAEQFTLNLQ